MARGKERNIVGGQIDPYVQQSMLQNKQLAENRLTTAMQEAGASARTVTQERGAGDRAALQAQTQRDVSGAQLEAQDKRAAEDEIARRDDRKFSQTMAEASQGFQARQAELNRDQQNAIIAGDRKAKDEIEKRREALRRFNTELGMDANERNTNAMLSILKGSLNKETSMEKAKTVLNDEADQFDKDKDVYSKTIDRVSEAVDFDKRMDLPTPAAIKEKTPSKWGVAKEVLLKGPVIGGLAELQKYKGLKKEIKEGLADPMGVLQDQIDKYGGSISIEDLTSGTISNIEDKIQTEDIQTEDINKTIGVLEGMLNSIDTKRKAVDKDSVDYDFWQDTHLEIAQMRDNLEGLVSSKKKITGSDKETVGSRVQYALGTVNNSSLGGRAARMRDLVGGDFKAVFDEMTKSIQVPKLYDISPDMNKYDVEYRTWFNNYLSSRYPELQEIGIEEGIE
ncbi:MAG TPA: hypothetical protein ENI23_07730 [bacterium]|nr:hypothetical protein [bacterium]